MQVLTTKKKKHVVTMPDKNTKLVIPNGVTYACYNFTLMEERLLNYCIYYSRHYAQKIFDGTAITQLDIFENSNTDINIHIPLNEMGAPYQYDDIRCAAKSLVSKTIRIGRTIQGRLFDTIQGIFSMVATLPEPQRSNYMIVQIKREVAWALINFKPNEKNKPCNYTTFIYEICLEAKCKYTPRIYKIISRWKDRGGCTLTIDEICDTLQLDQSYRKAYNIRRNILEPVQKELMNRSDIWFNCADIEQITEGKKVIAFRFKIIEPDLENANKIYLDRLYQALEIRFRLDKNQISQIMEIAQDPQTHHVLTQKLIQLEDIFLEDNQVSVKNRRIKNRPAYTVQAIFRLFQPTQMVLPA